MSSVAIPIQASSSSTTSSSSSSMVSNNLNEEESFTSVTRKDALLQAQNSNLGEGKPKITASPGLPSPTESVSETSDYQRSTPSPKDDIDSDIGNLR